jgi:hypothetical protein
VSFKLSSKIAPNLSIDGQRLPMPVAFGQVKPGLSTFATNSGANMVMQNSKKLSCVFIHA